MGTTLKVVLSDGTPAIDFNESIPSSTPIELRVSSLAEQGFVCSSIVMQSINYIFRGVSNYASGKVSQVEVSKDWFGKLSRNNDKMEWGACVPESEVVVYDISLEEIEEHFYIANSVKFGRNKKVQPEWNERLITPTPESLKEGIKTAIEIATEFPTDYRLVWGHRGKRGLFILDDNGKRVDVVKITEDETFVLFRMLLLMASKRNHVGVYCIDARGMSDTLLRALVDASKTFYGDGFIFIKNLSGNSLLERSAVEVPVF